VSKRRGLPQTSRMRHDSHFVEQLVRADELPVGRRIPIHLIEANPDQPRSTMGDLSGLTKSITDKGVLEPILVRPRDDGRFTIISGERRFRAAIEAGLAEIPCIEMDVADNELLEIALIENLQRKDLSPFEEADGYRALQEKHAYTHEQIADAVGKSRSQRRSRSDACQAE
jgi:ParB family chromosome partitioning protein